MKPKEARPPRSPLVLAPALRQALRGYRWGDLRADVLAGLVVGVIALPLSMALAVASGVAPQHGLYTAVVAGGVIALLGGSAVQVSGPTAAFVVLLAPVTASYGLGGLATASMVAGAILVGMGLARMGRLIEFIPYPVTTGFTAGIAIVIATLQVKDLLGLPMESLPPTFVEKVMALASHAEGVSVPDLLVGLMTLAALLVMPRLTKRLPAALVALPLAAVAGVLMAHFGGEAWAVDTIRTRFPQTDGVPRQLPALTLPWLLPGGDGRPLYESLNFAAARALLAAGLAIAMLGAIESLLSAVVADGMTDRRHDPDAELIAQGAGNLAAPLFGGFAATGAIARTATNVRAGARSPIAAVVHALFVLGAMLGLAPLLGYIPMSAMAAMLLIVAWNMSELRHVAHVLRIAPRSDKLVLITCLTLTVAFDMVIAVSVGVVLAALLFMERMAELTNVRLIGAGHPELPEPLPEGVLLYRVDGPLFFGAAQRAVSALTTTQPAPRAVLIDLSSVPHMDATGLTAFDSVLRKLHAARAFVVIAGVQEQPLRLMASAGWKHREWLVVWRKLEDGLALLRTLSDSDFAHVQDARRRG